MLPVNDDIGKALTADEERALLEACGKSRLRSLLPFITMLIETGARYNTVRTLQWKNIDFANRCLKFGKNKTASGSGRIIPLNSRAVTMLSFGLQAFRTESLNTMSFRLRRWALTAKRAT